MRCIKLVSLSAQTYMSYLNIHSIIYASLGYNIVKFVIFERIEFIMLKHLKV